VQQLWQAGIRAELAERYPTYGGVLRFSIFCLEADRERAVEIIDAALAKQRS
jgi:hypothetical protein